MGPDRIQSRVMTELVEDLTKSLFIIYHQSWLIGEVPDEWRLANVMPIYKRKIQGNTSLSAWPPC